MTDLYELTMMQGYYKTGNRKRVIFDVFYRHNPSGNGYAIAAGLQQIIEYIDGIRFTEEDIAYLREQKCFDEDFLDYLREFRFTGDIFAVPEGTVVFPKEPLIKVIAPIIEAQFLETALLNLINHQSLIATKAARVVEAAQGDDVMEFGLRRAQGPDAGIYGARAAIIGGCDSTSNVLAGQMFDVPVRGTHAHSWVMSFPDEYTAFREYSRLYPKSCLLLVDTYNTIKSGVPNAIRVFDEMKAAGVPLTHYGIRLDSGDLAYVSKETRKLLDAAGYTDAIISASSDLDEYLITDLKAQGAAINSWGVGTNMITSKDCPAFGGVYKLAAIEDEFGELIPKIKLSENADKVTYPGNKMIHRIYDKENGKIKADLIAFADELFDPEKDLTLYDPTETWKRTTLKGGSYKMQELLFPIFKNGVCVYTSPSVTEIREYCRKEKETLWEENRRLANPHKIHVDLSDRVYDVQRELFQKFSEDPS